MCRLNRWETGKGLLTKGAAGAKTGVPETAVKEEGQFLGAEKGEKKILRHRRKGARRRNCKKSLKCRRIT